MESVVLDTSALMNYNNIIEKLSKQYNIIIPIVVVEELDHLKTNKDTERAYKARKAIKQIKSNFSKVRFDLEKRVAKELCSVDENVELYNLNDDIIVTSALFNMAKLCTFDLNLQVKANALSVNVVDFENEYIYKGYVKYCFTTDEFNDFYQNRFNYFDNYYINQYIIIESKEDEKFTEYRFDGNDLVPIKLPQSKIIKAKNSLQRCALDMLYNNNIDICVLLGSVGSGKTYLSLQMALNSVTKTGKQSKILGIRSPYGTGKDVGYLKGTFEDKTNMFFYPIQQSLDGGVYEMQKYIDEGVLTTNIPYYMKGCTYNDTIMMCDEAEDFTESEIRLIGTRLGNNSRIFFSGDYKQSEINKTATNPLIKMCKELKGNPRFACICLDDDVRSEASKLFAFLFK